jgi:hypothetical protein
METVEGKLASATINLSANDWLTRELSYAADSCRP